MKTSLRNLLATAGLAGLTSLALAAGTPAGGSNEAPSGAGKAVQEASAQPPASPAAHKKVKKHAARTKSKKAHAEKEKKSAQPA